MTEYKCQAQKAILARLDNLNIKYVQLQHDPIFSVSDGEHIAKELDIIPCKNILLRNRQQKYFLIMTLGHKRLNIRDIASKTNSSHLSFASDEEVEQLLHAGKGCINPLGLMFDTNNRIDLLIDKDLLDLSHIGCHPSTNDCSLKINLSDLIHRFLPSTNHTIHEIGF